MLNGLQFMRKLAGELRVDENKVKKLTAEFTKDYPFGKLVIDREGFSVQVRYTTDIDGTPLCVSISRSF